AQPPLPRSPTAALPLLFGLRPSLGSVRGHDDPHPTLHRAGDRARLSRAGSLARVGSGEAALGRRAGAGHQPHAGEPPPSLARRVRVLSAPSGRSRVARAPEGPARDPPARRATNRLTDWWRPRPRRPGRLPPAMQIFGSTSKSCRSPSTRSGQTSGDPRVNAWQPSCSPPGPAGIRGERGRSAPDEGLAQGERHRVKNEPIACVIGDLSLIRPLGTTGIPVAAVVSRP